MLPHVHAEDGHLSPNNGILILRRYYPQALTILDEPPPAAALQAEQGLPKGGLERLGTAPDVVDGGRQAGCAAGARLGGAGRGQVLPEEGVVDVAAAVEADGGLESDLGGDVGGGDGRGVRLEGGVEAGNVGLVVLGVVELHDLLGDTGLESLQS